MVMCSLVLVVSLSEQHSFLLWCIGAIDAISLVVYLWTDDVCLF